MKGKDKTGWLVAGTMLGLLAGGLYVKRRNLLGPKPTAHGERLLEELNGLLENYDQSRLNTIYWIVQDHDIKTIQYLRQKQVFTYEELTAMYLDRWRQTPEILGRDVVALSHQALEEAKRCDQSYKEGLPVLYGMPLIVKETIELRGLPILRGLTALSKRKSLADASVVRDLKRQGAVILGKYGYRKIRNWIGENVYFDGGAALLAHNQALGAVGTGLAGQLISESVQQSLFGYRPSVGTYAMDGVLPLSDFAEVIGFMGRSVSDVWLMAQGAQAQSFRGEALKVQLGEEGLQPNVQSLTVSIMASNDGDFGLLDRVASLMKEEEVEVTYQTFEPSRYSLPKLIRGRVRKAFDFYRANTVSLLPSFEEVIYQTQRIGWQRQTWMDRYLTEALKERTSDHHLKEVIDTYKSKMADYFEEYQADILAVVERQIIQEAAVAGLPEVTIPIGVTMTNDPLSLTLIGRQGQDDQLIQFARKLSHHLQTRS